MSTLSTTPGVVTPSGISYWAGPTPNARVENGSLGIEQSLGHQTSLDVTYVGNFSRNQDERENINAVPLGANFQPGNISPVTGTANTQDGSSQERVNYPGYQDINKMIFAGHSNYNSLQTSVSHRISSGFLLGVAYTWSRNLGATSFDPLVPNNDARNYGALGQSRNQTLEINYSYQLPGSRNAWANAVVGNWTFSGLTSLNAGFPFGFGYNGFGVDFTGSQNEGARANLVGNPLVGAPAGSIFNVNAIAKPAVGTLGNQGNNPFVMPGNQNWDMTLSKFIPVGLDRESGLTLQVQAFNVFNHAEFTNWGSNINSPSNFGKPTGDLGARVLALNLRFAF
jgi:hypothetical protein